MSASRSDGSAEGADWAGGADPASRQRKPDIAILPGAVDLASPVGAGDPMPELAGDLEDAQTGAENVDGEPNLGAPAARQR